MVARRLTAARASASRLAKNGCRARTFSRSTIWAPEAPNVAPGLILPPGSRRPARPALQETHDAHPTRGSRDPHHLRGRPDPGDAHPDVAHPGTAPGSSA